MADDEPEVQERVSPSDFMRQLRPEYYSDTTDRASYELGASTLEYHLNTITARNQTHEFELFCRKLCERAICPNLKPATGPEGGGDSKADTETIPVADEITKLYFIGEPNSGRERWGFAFSAKAKWTEKVRSDVAGLIATGRHYDKIICVTARFARGKNRARIEDELSRQYGVPVTILDRTWIVEQIVDSERKDLAFNYLGVGQEVRDGAKLGPVDYSRVQQLREIEKAIEDPSRFEGMELQRVTEALVAAKLSRNLERPRVETAGRFERAIRLADDDGTSRQRLEARYERIWTGFWWFDDVAMLNRDYDDFATLCLKSDHAIDIEFLCNLTQLLFNATIHGHLSRTEARLEDRITRLVQRLDAMALDTVRPNNALQARMELLVIETNRAVLERHAGRLAAVWPHFSEILEQARGLGEFPAEKLTRLIEVFGMVAGSDARYAELVDKTAEFVGSRKSEAEGALVLLRRAQQLDFDERFEMIRLLGKAAHHLSKKEYADSMIEATRLLALAYRSAGLLWAARASCMLAIASIFIESEHDSDVPVAVVPTLMLFAWIAVELRHLPDALEAIRLARGCVASLPLTEESKKHARERLDYFDLVLASQLLNLSPKELADLSSLPDVLGGLELQHSAMALLYALGHEPFLRESGAIPPEMTSGQIGEFYDRLASQPVAEDLRAPVIFNSTSPSTYTSFVLGIRVDVEHLGTDATFLAAEAIVGAIEALFATTVELDVFPHVERFRITIEASDGAEPTYSVDAERSTALVQWPNTLLPGDFHAQEAIHDLLLKLSATILVAACAIQDTDALFARLFEDDGVLHRISIIVASSNSRSRVLRSPLGRLSDWTALSANDYPIRASRPHIVRQTITAPRRDSAGDAVDGLASQASNTLERPRIESHRNLSLHSVIDVHLWDRAGWKGTAFAQWGNRLGIGLLFQDTDAGREIFEKWRARFGAIDRDEDIYLAVIRGISDTNPAHYRVMITSRPPAIDARRLDQTVMIAARMQTMEPATDVNLTRFLQAYSPTKRYLLMPAALGINGAPELMWQFALEKRELSVKMASDVTIKDIEMMALKPQASGRALQRS